MNSINQEQPEDNHLSLEGKAAVEKIRELAKAASTCFFCTRLKESIPVRTRPMAVQKVDDQGSLWFLSASDSHQNKEIAADPVVQLFFQGSAHSDFLTLTGKAVISTDRKIIDELWSPFLKTWFTKGKDDPRITVIKVIPAESYYWDNKHGNGIAFIKMLTGAALGRTFDDSIEGKLKV